MRRLSFTKEEKPEKEGKEKKKGKKKPKEEKEEKEKEKEKEKEGKETKKGEKVKKKTSLLAVEKTILEKEQKNVKSCINNYQKGRTRGLHLQSYGYTDFPHPDVAGDRQAEKLRKRLRSLFLNRNRLESFNDGISTWSFLTTLSATHNSFNAIPVPLSKLVNLTSLNLSYNQIDTLPIFLSPLTALKDLNLSWNRVGHIDEKLFPSLASSLTTLSLPGNRLSLIPSSISCLDKLSTLDVSHNFLASLPKDIGGLVSLRSLNVSYNLIDELPSSLENCTQLESLSLWENKISSYPKSMLHLKKLKSFHFGGNKLPRFDQGKISRMQKASSSIASNLGLSSPPPGMSPPLTSHSLSVPTSASGPPTPHASLLMFQCEEVDIDNNLISELGGDGSAFFWSQLAQVRSFRAARNAISRIGPFFCAHSLSSLTTLDLSYNSLDDLPEHFSHFQALSVLDVSCNHLENGPSLEAALKGLTGLVCLNLGCNRLTRLPEALGLMSSMRWLNLFGNVIEQVDPHLLSNMKPFFEPSAKARSLRLGYNRLTEFPLICTKMKCLQELHLAGNNIKIIPESIANMSDLLVLSFANNESPLVIPESITQLKKLRKLYLRGSVCEIPESLVDINSLVEVDISPALKKEINPVFRLGIPLQISLENDSQPFHKYKHGVAKMSSKKNEDRFAIRTYLGEEGYVGYYGVFDGHAGSDVSDFCSFRLHEMITGTLERGAGKDLLEELAKMEGKISAGKLQRKKLTSLKAFHSVDLSSDMSDRSDRSDGKKKKKKKEDPCGLSKIAFDHAASHTHPLQSFAQLIWESFLACDFEMKRYFLSNNIRLSQGSTGVVALTIGCYLFIANVGDARAVLGAADGQVLRLSIDHTPQERSEAFRVVDEKGHFVVDSLLGKTLRVALAGQTAQLAITRSFGDFQFGEVVTAAPSISIFDLSTLPPPTNGANVLILACDGVWDVLEDGEAVRVVRAAEDDMTQASVMLRDFAYLRDSGDDLTVVCVCLDRLPDRF